VPGVQTPKDRAANAPKNTPSGVLTERQSLVLRALVAAYVAAAAPVGSRTIAQRLTVPLSSASVRNTLAELSDLGLIRKAHASAGRVPTSEGIRVFVERLLDLGEVAQYTRRSIDRSFGEVGADAAVKLASRLLSDHTHQLGFGVAPRLERLAIRHLSFVRLSADRILAVLVDARGQAHQRVIEDPFEGERLEAAELDRMAAALSERIAGRSLTEAVRILRREVRSLRNRATRMIERALLLGLVAAEAMETHDAGELVVATRLALLEQPEFSDPERVRELLAALEQSERLVDLLEQLLDGDGVSIALGDELAAHGLTDCAVVAAPYGGATGMLGVIGPTRMDYGRIIPLVAYCSRQVTEKLSS
jgi:heat-inducible transcriptional repressor